MNRPVVLELMVWELVERNQFTAIMEAAREAAGIRLAREIFDDLGDAERTRSVLAILSAGLTYLALRQRKITWYNGINLRSDQGWAELQRAVQAMVEGLASPAAPRPGKRRRRVGRNPVADQDPRLRKRLPFHAQNEVAAATFLAAACVMTRRVTLPLSRYPGGIGEDVRHCFFVHSAKDVARFGRVCDTETVNTYRLPFGTVDCGSSEYDQIPDRFDRGVCCPHFRP